MENQNESFNDTLRRLSQKGRINPPAERDDSTTVQPQSIVKSSTINAADGCKPTILPRSFSEELNDQLTEARRRKRYG